MLSTCENTPLGLQDKLTSSAPCVVLLGQGRGTGGPERGGQDVVRGAD
jgi:hypothetical protein